MESKLLVLTLLAATGPFGHGSAERPNVLFIAVDDLRPELGCLGSASAQTPQLDRLAAGGVAFTRHFASVPTCGASRYALLTGRSPHRSRALGNDAFHRGPSRLAVEPGAGARTFPELFRRSGYRTVCIGKVSHTPDGRLFAYDGSGDGRAEMPNAWDELTTPFAAWERGWGAFFAYAGGRHREDGHGHRDLMEFAVERDEDLPDGLIAARAVETLRTLRERDEPFFLGVGFYKPHLPFVATAPDHRAMQDEDVAPPGNAAPIESAYAHESGEFSSYRASWSSARPEAPADVIQARRAYLTCVRFVDRQIGRVLDALDELGLADDTIVVVWGDHGFHLGESGMWGKHTPFDRALNATLIVRAPGVTTQGLVSDALVESLDLYPTLIDLCRPGFERTEHPLDGVSLRPVLTGERESVRDAAVGYWRRAVTVRTARHRLIATRDGSAFRDVELYDLSDGPDPGRNIASEANETVAALLARVPRDE